MGKRGPHARPVRAVADPAASTPKGRFPGRTRAEKVVRWCETLTITSGASAGQKLAVRPWQRAVLAAIYAETGGKRRVRTAVISTGRKAGKSTLCAALALCHLVGPEAVARGQVVSAAADRGQASIIYAELKAFALAEATIADRLVFRDYNKTVEDVVTGSTFTVLSADHRKAHGLSPTVAICDEVAQWRGRELLDGIASGQGAHREPLLLAISTRSPDPGSPFESLLDYARQVEDGVIVDPTVTSAIYSAPADADPWAEATWRIANPDATAERIADIAAQAAKAKRLPSLMPAFEAYVLNRPARVEGRFIAPADWDACDGEAPPAGPVYGGLDLSAGANDLTAAALYWPETGRLVVRAFLPVEAIEAKAAEDGAPYGQWLAAGHVVAMPGRAIDRAWLLTWFAAETDGLDLRAVATDRWGLTDLQAVQDREGLHLPLVPFGQGYKDMSPALAVFESAVLDAKLKHGGNPLLRWAVANAVVDTDPAGARKVTKARSRGRVDPLVAAIEAVAIAGRAPAAPRYEHTGMMLV